MTDYEQGYIDGIAVIADVMRRAAERVAQTGYSDFEGRDGRKVRAIAHIGNVSFAAKLREVADLIDAIASDIKKEPAHDRTPPTH